MRTRTTYKVTTSHAKWEDGNGTFELEVTFEPLPEDRRWGDITGTRFVSGSPFGCSRDYYVTSDKDAICSLLAEHATTLVSMQKVTSSVRAPGIIARAILGGRKGKGSK